MRKRARFIIQVFATALTNAHVNGFLKGGIYRGNTKVVCVPGLNCYSCPGAMGACPIGAMQAVISGNQHNFSYYVFGILMLFGVLFGRMICGFLCPFGFIQDLLHKIRTPKLRVPKQVDKPMRYLKYAVFVIMVIMLPALVTNAFGTGSPSFCQWICPAGTLEGGIPLVLLNEGLRSALGFLFGWKLAILIIVLVLSVIIYRPFCKYLCPLGAFYSIFNKISFFGMRVDQGKCTGCGACIKTCKMGISSLDDINGAECIRCGECKNVCPKGAINYEFRFYTKKKDGISEAKVEK